MDTSFSMTLERLPFCETRGVRLRRVWYGAFCKVLDIRDIWNRMRQTHVLKEGVSALWFGKLVRDNVL